MSGALDLTLAVNRYDHVRDLADGTVPVEGVALRCLSFSVEETFFRFGRFREWDVSEMSLAKYSSLRAGFGAAWTQSVFGEDLWPYGVEANRPTLDVFLGGAAEQGVNGRRLQPEELLAPETLQRSRV